MRRNSLNHTYLLTHLKILYLLFIIRRRKKRICVEYNSKRERLRCSLSERMEVWIMSFEGGSALSSTLITFLLGLGIVFIGLIALIAIIKIMGAIMRAVGRSGSGARRAGHKNRTGRRHGRDQGGGRRGACNDAGRQRQRHQDRIV